MPSRKRTCCAGEEGKAKIVRSSKDSDFGVCPTCGRQWKWDTRWNSGYSHKGQWQPAKLFVIHEIFEAPGGTK